MLKPGDAAPYFDLPCALDDKLSRLSLASITSDLVVLFFYPRDFSFICPTEVIGFHKARAAFAAESTTVVGVSVDDAETHRRWARELGGLAYPLLADEGGKVARAFGVLDEAENVALRATFIIDRKRIILYAVASPVNVGRSVGETLRVVRALRSGKLCPADWEPGADVEPTDAKY
jgi:peroxiredoxin (alkyl hydroperoxide reductase subunit C)